MDSLDSQNNDYNPLFFLTKSHRPSKSLPQQESFIRKGFRIFLHYQGNLSLKIYSSSRGGDIREHFAVNVQRKQRD